MESRAQDAPAWSIAGLVPCMEPSQSSAIRFLLSARVINGLSSIRGGKYFPSALQNKEYFPTGPGF